MRLGVQRWKEHLYDRRPGWVDGRRSLPVAQETSTPGHAAARSRGWSGKGRPGQFPSQGSGSGGGRSRLGDRRQWSRGSAGTRHGRASALQAESFDLVFADWVVEHLADPSAMASEIFRVLRPGGLFIFRTGNLRHYSYAIADHTPHWFHQLVANPVRPAP